ncbi:MAG TPA: Fe-S cluster assembly protein HesB [Candidatus Dormibacteraeota bacterium]|nr:Fe-S cluster assembly protein HesB [Candidatus Dormibacteraeota bacterium]HVC22645.1 Fe-S cluster assembly protein HesB [Candidatus Dormibacteraeota bacterium]
MSKGSRLARPIGTFKLRGGGGELVDWKRALASHGVATLPPNRIDTAAWLFKTTLAAADGGLHNLSIREERPHLATVTVDAELGAQDGSTLLATCRRMLRLDDDLSRFYELAEGDPELSWVTAGAGRMLRSPTVFEDVVKTICTTNCSWSGTERMVGALVTALGRTDREGGHAFPTPQAMADADLDFYRDEARTGYRGAYLRALARAVADGDLDLEALNDPELPDAEAESRLLALPGVGPYATAHIMLTALGRYGLLILDSWTRPTFAQLSGRQATDQSIRRRFRKFGNYRGLAFWLYLTRDWVAD